MKLFLLVLAILVTPEARVLAQADSMAVRIHMQDGSILVGSILEQDSSHLTLQSPSGVRSEIPRRSIDAIEHVTLNKRGEYFRPDPNNTRLFFIPTGKTIPQGSGYITDYELFFPSLAIGATDFLTLWGGMSLIPFSEAQLFYLSAKARLLHAGPADWSIGYMYCSALMFDIGDGLSLPYTSLTLGTERSSLTVAYGLPAFGNLSSDGILVIGGEAQVSNSIAFITENWIPLGGSEVIYSGGLRFFGDALCADFGLFGISAITGSSGAGFPFFPWVGFAYNWGKPSKH